MAIGNMTTTQKVSFTSKGLKVVGDLHIPSSSTPDRKKAAIVILHPFTAVKEQSAGLHAQRLAEHGFIALAFDAAYQGESEGLPRGLEDHYQRAEDMKCGVTYLSTLPEVDPTRIGALGICAGGGYTVFGAASDLRIKAVAAVSTVDAGRVTREGILGTSQVMTSAMVAGLLTQTAQDRIDEVNNDGKPAMTAMYPSLAEVKSAKSMGGWSRDFLEAVEYYQTDRAQHPRAPGVFPRRCYDTFATFDPFSFVGMISPRPLLMIAGTAADTRIFSEDAVRRAREPKELFLVPDATHVHLYDHLDGHLSKLIDFFNASLVE